MSLLHSILSKAGHGFSDLGKWVDDAIKIFEKDIAPTANAIISIVNPSLTPIVQKIESIVQNIQTVTQAPMSSASLQAITQAVTTLEMLAPGIVTPNTVANVTKVATEVQQVTTAIQTGVKTATAPVVTSTTAKP